MQFTKIGDLNVVTRVTGPHHHYLALALSIEEGGSTPSVEKVSHDDPTPLLDASDVATDLRREVMDAVAEVNRRLGASFKVMRIRYCWDDEFIPGVYGRLTRSLVEHVAREQEKSGAKTTRADGSLIEMNS